MRLSTPLTVALALVNIPKKLREAGNISWKVVELVTEATYCAGPRVCVLPLPPTAIPTERPAVEAQVTAVEPIVVEHEVSATGVLAMLLWGTKAQLEDSKWIGAGIVNDV